MNDQGGNDPGTGAADAGPVALGRDVVADGDPIEAALASDRTPADRVQDQWRKPHDVLQFLEIAHRGSFADPEVIYGQVRRARVHKSHHFRGPTMNLPVKFLQATLMLLTMGVATPGLADESLKEGARDVGRAVGTAAREVGDGAKKVGKAVAEAAKEGAEAVKEGAKEAKRAMKPEK